MTTGIELDDFSSLPKKKQETRTDTQPHEDGEMNQKDQSVAAWAWSSASLLLFLALPLLIAPRFLLFVLGPDAVGSRETLTPLEQSLSFQLSVFLVTIAITLVLYIPSDAPVTASPRKRDQFGHPLLGPLTGASLISSFVSYNTKSLPGLSFLLCLIFGIIGVWGLWAMLFEGSSRISKTTGVDKHTSSFIFGNKSAASIQKKRKKAERE